MSTEIKGDVGRDEERKMRVKYLKSLGMLEGVSFEDIDKYSAFRRGLEKTRLAAVDPELDKRPSANEMDSTTINLRQARVLEEVLAEVLRSSANDFDTTLALPAEYGNERAIGFYFEVYRGWTTEDVRNLVERVDCSFPDLNIEELRADSLARQEALEYDETRDLETIRDIDAALIYRGYAFDRLFKKIKQEPDYLEVVKQKLAPKEIESDDDVNDLEANMFLKKTLDFAIQHVAN